MDDKSTVVSVCKQLIRCKSYSGEERGVAECLRKIFLDLGYDDVMSDVYGNVIGVLRGKQPGKRILLDGHIDTVPVSNPDKWSCDPFEGCERDGKVYGRGASDMKGAVAAMAVAAASYAKEKQRNFPGTLYVAGVVYEELFEGVSARAISEAVQPDFVIIGEATNLNLKIGQRGRAEIVVETKGVPAHSANPEKGVNAVYKMMELIPKILAIPAPHQEELGDGILVLTDIISAPYPGASVVPERCIATFDRRLLVGETQDSVLEPIRQAIQATVAEAPTLSAEVSLREETQRCYTGNDIFAKRFFPGWYFGTNCPFIQAAYQALSTLRTTEITNYSFCTNGSHYAGERGICTIGYGPSSETLAHTVDEYIAVEQLTGAVAGYCALVNALLHL